jgi:hypothetical protein
MASNPVNIPSYRVPFLGQDGGNSREWFRYLELIGKRASTIGTEVSTSATAGAATALPPSPEGYLDVIIDGKQFKIPYYKP